MNDRIGTEHRAARAVIRGINRVITWIEVLVLLAMLLFGLYGIWDSSRIDSENTASRYEMYKPTAKDTRTYDDFRTVNPDVCGWLTITDTGIDYPLVHGKDNDAYMNKTADLRFALSGSLFLDYRNRRDFSDFNTIIYGHHMEGPSMFGALDRYQSPAFFQNHEGGLLYCGGQWHELEIFAYLEMDAYDQKLYSVTQDRTEFRDYLDYIRENAKQYRDIGVSAGDRILVMSTCMTDRTNGRYIVAARIGAVTDGPQKQETGQTLPREGLSPRERNVIFAAAGGLILFALILLYLFCRKRNRRRRMRSTAEESCMGTDRSRKHRSEKNDPEQSGSAVRKTYPVAGDLLSLLIRIGIIAAAVGMIFSFVFGVYVNSGPGMEPSVQDRDIILFYRLDSEYTANEAVVYWADGGEHLGRIAASGGDTVEITDEGLRVNGYLQQDYKSTGETLAVRGGIEYPVTLAEDEVFILGDSREKSTDSRMYGPVKLSEIRGSVLAVLRRRDV